MKLKHTALAGITAALLTFTVGCGSPGTPETDPFAPGTDPGTNEPGTPNAPETPSAPIGDESCALLIGVDLEALLGEPVAVDESSAETCSYVPADPEGIGSILLQVHNQHGAITFAALKSMFGEGAPSAGIGDESFINSGMLYAVKGDRMLGLFVIRNPFQQSEVEESLLRASFDTIQRNAGW